MIDRAPDGEIEAAGGCSSTPMDGNWKLLFREPVRPPRIPCSRTALDRGSQAQSDEVHSDGSGEIAIRQMRQNGGPTGFWESQVGIWTYPNGHQLFSATTHDDSKLVRRAEGPVSPTTLTALEKKKGKAEAQRILEVRALELEHLSERLADEPSSRQLRVVHPIAVNRTVVHTYTSAQGRAGQMFRNTISFANLVNGTGSWC